MILGINPEAWVTILLGVVLFVGLAVWGYRDDRERRRSGDALVAAARRSLDEMRATNSHLPEGRVS